MSNLTTVTYPNGVTSSYSYDDTNLPLSITHTGPDQSVLASFTYTRRDSGALASTTTAGITAPFEDYDYSPLAQLAAVNTGSYDYDDAGNLTTTPTTSLDYDDAGQLTSSTALRRGGSGRAGRRGSVERCA